MSEILLEKKTWNITLKKFDFWPLFLCWASSVSKKKLFTIAIFGRRIGYAHRSRLHGIGGRAHVLLGAKAFQRLQQWLGARSVCANVIGITCLYDVADFIVDLWLPTAVAWRRRRMCGVVVRIVAVRLYLIVDYVGSRRVVEFLCVLLFRRRKKKHMKKMVIYLF